MPKPIILPLVERLSIATKDFAVVKFKPNWAQKILFNEIEKDIFSKRPSRNIILKARQLGISTAVTAFMYAWSFPNKRMRSQIIANEADNSQHLLSMTDLYWETDPLRMLYSTKYQAKNTLMWHETASSIRTMTAGNKEAGRSRTIQALHASEVAFWPEPEVTMTGLLSALPDRPNTFAFFESTANGVGNWFEQSWQEAMAGTGYRPLFFPWWVHPEYRASVIRIPRYEMHYNEEERNLIALFKTGLTIGEYHYSIPESQWDDALAWRRHMIEKTFKHDVNKFHQEYPSIPEEAFLSTGFNVFPLDKLRQVYEPQEGQPGVLVRDGARVIFKPDVRGPLRIFKYPSEDRDYGKYIIGGDSTHAIHDKCCAQVFNRRSLEQVAVWHGMMDPARFGEEIAKLGIYYNTALLAPENEGPGYATIGSLVQLDYPNLYQSEMPENLPGRIAGKWGWSSSYKTKEFAVGWTLKLVVEKQLSIHDRETFEQMKNFVKLDNGEYGPASATGFDDAVDPLCIAMGAHVLSGPLMAYGSETTPTAPAWQEETAEPSWMSWEENVEVYQ